MDRNAHLWFKSEVEKAKQRTKKKNCSIFKRGEKKAALHCKHFNFDRNYYEANENRKTKQQKMISLFLPFSVFYCAPLSVRTYNIVLHFVQQNDWNDTVYGLSVYLEYSKGIKLTIIIIHLWYMHIPYSLTNSPFKYEQQQQQQQQPSHSQVYSHPFALSCEQNTERMREHFKKEIPMQYEYQFNEGK